MFDMAIKGSGTREKPWVLETPPGTSEYQMYKAPDAAPPALVCLVGKTELRYHLRAIEDLHAMLKRHGDWMPLGAADEQKPRLGRRWRRTRTGSGAFAEPRLRPRSAGSRRR